MNESKTLQAKDWMRATSESLLSTLNLLQTFCPSWQTEKENRDKQVAFVNNYVKETLLKLTNHHPVFGRPIIESGLFQNIRIESVADLQAGIAQKLFGVYEIEIKEDLERFLKNKYDYVLNIGAAEGLYSIVFSKAFPSTPVYSYEESYHTRKLFRKLCAINNAENVEVLGRFDVEELDKLNSSFKGLVICDCEGFENVIFSQANIQKFLKSDILIETHDHMVPGTTTNIRNILEKNFEVKIVEQMSLESRASLIKEKAFNNLDIASKVAALDEDRNPLNRWIVASPKINLNL
ncbi:MAG: hypothetical protein IPP77_08860 [Bacteroidetes bacterium]|nr:hypothetical protein [Bacteroidota bacterium]